MTLHPQYIVDSKGKRKSVLLPLDEYEELLEIAQDVLDGALVDEVKGEIKTSWAKVRDKRTKRVHT